MEIEKKRSGTAIMVMTMGGNVIISVDGNPIDEIDQFVMTKDKGGNLHVKILSVTDYVHVSGFLMSDDDVADFLEWRKSKIGKETS